MQFISPQPFTQAVAKLTSRQIVTSGMDSAAWSRVPAALRETAFFSSKIQDARFLQETKNLIEDFLTGARETIQLPNGKTTTRLKVGSRAAFVQQAREFAIARGLGPVIADDKGTLKDITSEKRLALIFKIQTESANAYGDWQQGMSPAVLNAYPAWEFYRAEEVKEPRYLHKLNEGRIELKTNLGFWGAMNSPNIGGFNVPWGPWGFGSGMWTRDVDRARAEQLNLLTPSTVLKPAHEDLAAHQAAGIATLDPETRAWLKSQLGDQVEFDGDTARWRSPQVLPPNPGRAPAVVPPPPSPEPAPTRRTDYKAVLDNLATLRQDPAADLDALHEAALKAIEVPEAQRAALPLKMETSDPAVQSVAKVAARTLQRLVRPDLVGNLQMRVRSLRGDDRAFYSDSERTINLSPNGPLSTACHEMIHGVEMQNGLFAKAAAFLVARGRGERPQKLSKLTRINRYRPNEIAFQDKWEEKGGRVYSGKLYSTDPSRPDDPSHVFATEILTMGFERLIEDAVKFWTTDPEYCSFVIETLCLL